VGRVVCVLEVLSVVRAAAKSRDNNRMCNAQLTGVKLDFPPVSLHLLTGDTSIMVLPSSSLHSLLFLPASLPCIFTGLASKKNMYTKKIKNNSGYP
jgi:hypothetical protein